MPPPPHLSLKAKQNKTPISTILLALDFCHQTEQNICCMTGITVCQVTGLVSCVLQIGAQLILAKRGMVQLSCIVLTVALARTIIKSKGRFNVEVK